MEHRRPHAFARSHLFRWGDQYHVSIQNNSTLPRSSSRFGIAPDTNERIGWILRPSYSEVSSKIAPKEYKGYVMDHFDNDIWPPLIGRRINCCLDSVHSSPYRRRVTVAVLIPSNDVCEGSVGADRRAVGRCRQVDKTVKIRLRTLVGSASICIYPGPGSVVILPTTFREIVIWRSPGHFMSNF